MAHLVPCNMATPIRGQAVRTSITARASRFEQGLAVATANVLATAAALADERMPMTAPSLSDLKEYQAGIEAASQSAAASVSSAVELGSGDDISPLLAGLAVGILLVGGVLAAVTGEKGPSVKSISAAKAIDLLAEDPDAQLLDVRPKVDIKATGSPDLRSIKKSVSALPWVPPVGPATDKGTVVVGWPQKFGRLSKFSEESLVILLDVDGTEAPAAAKAIAEVYPDAKVVYYVTGGAESWLENELPWVEPFSMRGIDLDFVKSLDFTGVTRGTDALVTKYRENPTPINAAVATVAVAGASVFLFAEMETILQVVGILGAGQFLARKLLFAENREQTFLDIKTLVNEKIGAGEASQDFKQLARTILDSTDEVDVAGKTVDVPAPENARAATKTVDVSEPETAESTPVPSPVAEMSSPTETVDVPTPATAAKVQPEMERKA